MKQTYNINIAGHPYVIDADAYEMLHDYLETLRHAFSHEEGCNDIIEDIEERISEILSEYLESNNTSIVTIREIRLIITRIGRPEEMTDVIGSISGDSDEVTEEIKESSMQMPPPILNQRVTKRLFRDPNDKLLGGVCSGLAAYLNIDPTWVRLAVVVLCFLSFNTMAIIYFILWIVVPEAKTPLERLQMRGEPPTVENIGEAVTSEFSPKPDNEGHGVHGAVSNLMRICAIIVKIFLVLLCIIFTPVLFALIVAFFGCIIALIGISFAPLDFITGDLLPAEVRNILFFSMALIAVIGIPLVVIIMMIWNNSRKKNAISRQTGITLSVIWIIAIAAAIISGSVIRNTLPDMSDRVERINRVVSEIEEQSDSLSDTVDSISIQAESIPTDSISISRPGHLSSMTTPQKEK